jgi:hypothetical protein
VKIGTENRTKTIIAGVLLIVAVIFVVRAFRGGDEDASPAPAPAATASGPAPGSASGQAAPGATRTARKPPPLLAQTLDPTLRFDLLKSSEEVAYKGTGRDIFRSQAEEPPLPKPLPPGPQPIPAPPPPPPIPLKFYGFANRIDGNKRIFLSKGEDIFVAKEGDIVDRRYKVVHIGTNSVEVQDVLTNYPPQTLPLSLS